MGDRGNIKIVDDDGGPDVYFYTHWRGSDLESIVRAALIRGKVRWDDGPYLARIIFCELVKGDENGTTGCGISTTLGDGGDRIYVVNLSDNTARWEGKPPQSFEAIVMADALNRGKTALLGR